MSRARRVSGGRSDEEQGLAESDKRDVPEKAPATTSIERYFSKPGIG